MEALGLDSMSGRLLMPREIVLLTDRHLPLVAAAVTTPGHIRHLLLEMTTFATLAIMEHLQPLLTVFFSSMTRCGMVLVVVAPAPAAHSTTLHGSARPSPSPPPTTWKLESATVNRIQTRPSNSWRFTCNNNYATKSMTCLLYNHLLSSIIITVL